jgi:hypothetical protein
LAFQEFSYFEFPAAHCQLLVGKGQSQHWRTNVDVNKEQQQGRWPISFKRKSNSFARETFGRPLPEELCQPGASSSTGLDKRFEES